MKALILFDLKRRLLNRMNILINAVLILAVFFVFHIDYFLGNNSGQRHFYIDDSVKPFQDCFEQLERNYITYNGQLGEQDILINFDGRFTIISNSPVEEDVLREIRADIRQAASWHYLQQYPALKSLVNEYAEISLDVRQKSEKPTGLWMISSLMYFLLMNYSSTVASDVVYEKSARLLESLMTMLTPQQHMLAKIIEGYLTVIIQTLLAVSYAATAFLVRYLEDGLNGLVSFLSISEAGNVSLLLIDFRQLLMIAGLMVSSLVIVQTMMLLVCSRLTSSQQAATVQGVFYVLLLIGYYLLLVHGEDWVINESSICLYAGLPVVSGYLMSCLILLKKATLLQGLLALGINIVTLLMIIEFAGRKYRQNLLRF